MRNLLLLQDTISTSLTDAGASDLVALCRDLGSNNLFVLTDAGVLYSIDPLTGSQIAKHESWILSSECNNSSQGWFNVTIVNETGAIVCISHSGLLVSIKEDPVSCQWSHTVEQEGDVEGGIATAAWSPDTSRLALLTNNNTLLLMTGFWDVLAEIPLPTSRVPNSPCGISWRGDGEYLSVVTTDAEDGITRARVYTKGTRTNPVTHHILPLIPPSHSSLTLNNLSIHSFNILHLLTYFPMYPSSLSYTPSSLSYTPSSLSYTPSSLYRLGITRHWS